MGMDNRMPKAPMGFVNGGGNPNSKDESFYGHVNVTAPRFVDERDSCFKNPHAVQNRSYAHDSGAGKRGRGGRGSANANPDVGGR